MSPPSANGPDQAVAPSERRSAPPPNLDDVMPIRVQGSLAMLLGSLVLLGALILAMARIQHWAGNSGLVQFRTTNANGLQEGMEVRLSGYRIGLVDRIQLEPDAVVRVTLLIQPSYRRFLGPRSQVRMVQDTLIGSGNLALTPDPKALRGRRGLAPPRQPLLLSYTPPPNLPELLSEVAQSRLPLIRFFNSSSRLVEGDLPKVMRSTSSTLEAARDLAKDLRLQVSGSAAEVRSTAKVTRRALAVYENLGREGIQRLGRADSDLRANGPQLLNTLRGLDAMTANLNRLVDRLSRSWLFDLLGEPSRVPSPLGPPASGSSDPSSNQQRQPAALQGHPGISGPPAPTGSQGR